MKVSEFDYDLPEGLIALRPVSPRDAAKMLVVGPEGVEDRGVLDLASYLRDKDIVVFNDTKVLPVRLSGTIGEGRVEATLLKPLSGGKWTALAKPGKKFKPGAEVDFEGLKATVVSRGEGGEIILDFHISNILQALDKKGKMPLPPYIAKKRQVDHRDRADYQTIYAQKDGAVAAPTAGLHFTGRMMKTLKEKGVRCVFVTLHVGAGTFLPVKVEDTRDHKMHTEWGEISQATAEAINRARTAGGRVVAVGTTSLRLLESAADQGGKLHPFKGETGIFITPGYQFRAVDVLMTNFHLPKSTLFMLVSAFSGLEAMKSAYKHAIENDYRFYSYGDSSLLYPKQ
ncbi:MAG: tRNA preQ1(34) S-adenosylmethionine ribosyltransferase-isomerase QueA [Proteobacteria bacterium]|nr:tRNA preQ1(34) S-adenosylmethionine ribosyltransferase-isomerase QueA [Pseudomonadota bacterium]